MSQLDQTNIAATSISTPSAGVTCSFIDATHKSSKQKDDAGYVRGGTNNFSIASQAPAAATRTYLAGSNLSVPTNKLQVGTVLRWKFNMTKTAAGIAASTIDVAVGTAGTTADTARLSFTKPAGTAVIDEAWVDVICTVRSIGATGVMVGEFVMVHNLAATGHAVIPVVVANAVSAGFDVTVSNLIVGLCLTTGAADVITIQMMQAEAFNL
jgi:hypothetical protein